MIPRMLVYESTNGTGYPRTRISGVNPFSQIVLGCFRMHGTGTGLDAFLNTRRKECRERC